MNIVLISSIILINFIRFLDLESVPPGFYVDEAYAAVQVLCIQLSGKDYFGTHLPLFAISGPGVAIYTPPFLYGEVFWTLLFGSSVAAYRSFIACVTLLTFFFIFTFIRRSAGIKVALWVVFCGSLMPWSFIFSRIAWDPPLAVLFTAMFLWGASMSNNYWIGGVFIALAAYSYPPMRLIALPLILFMPGITMRRKFVIAGVAAIVCLPMLWFILNKPNFMIRSHMLAIWSPFFGNPYRNLEFIPLLKIIWGNFASHFSVNFLFFHGEKSLRSSIQSFGMLSWLDFTIFLLAPPLLFWKKYKNRSHKIFLPVERQLICLAVIGVVLSFIPSALTNEAPPHALRSVTAWLFISIFSGVLINKFIEIFSFKSNWVIPIGVGAIFFSLYLWSYFVSYPKIAKEAFQMDYFTAFALPKLREGDSETCKDIKTYLDSSSFSEIAVGENISFADNFQRSNKFLWDNWHEKESWGVWSNGKRASLYLPKRNSSAKFLELKVRAFVNGAHPNQVAKVRIGGNQFIFNISTPNDEILNINIESILNEDLWVEIDTPGSVSPMEAGMLNGDKRKLGIGLVGLSFK